MIKISAAVLLLAACASATLTQLEKEDILRVHNALRGEVYPQSADMQKMLWDDQLTTFAQEHSQQCVWAANQYANANSAASFPEGVGENLAFSFSSATSSDINPVRFVHEWFAESAFYNHTSNECAPKETCNHYTQLVWSKSHAIGCGLFTCDSFDFFGVTLPNATFFSCLYGTAGNRQGLKPYAAGTPCSECPAHLTGCSANLCTVAGDNGTATEGPLGLVNPTASGATTVTGGLELGPVEPMQGGNISAPPLVAMPPPSGHDVVTAAPTAEMPVTIPSLLPAHCEAPSTPTDREGCWRSAWLLWTQKYNQWAAGQCAQPGGAAATTATTATTATSFPLL